MIFEFSWSDYEDYVPHILEGEGKTREEFEADCNRALKESFEYFISATPSRSWAGLQMWTSFAVAKMEDYGYKIVRPMEFNCSGLALPKTDRYSEHNNEIDSKFYEENYPELLDEIKRMIRHNNALDETLYKDIYKKIDLGEDD